MQTQMATAQISSRQENAPGQTALQRRVLRMGDGSQAAIQAVANAEKAMEKLSVHFDGWMREETTRLGDARNRARASGMTAPGLDALFAASHDLKGQATTLGYPFAADICASLCRLIDACSRKARLPGELVNQHVDAVGAIVREEAKGPDHPKASVLASKLRDVTDDYLLQLARRNRAAK